MKAVTVSSLCAQSQMSLCCNFTILAGIACYTCILLHCDTCHSKLHHHIALLKIYNHTPCFCNQCWQQQVLQRSRNGKGIEGVVGFDSIRTRQMGPQTIVELTIRTDAFISASAAQQVCHVLCMSYIDVYIPCSTCTCAHS
jgi:Dimerisation domain of Zinc Transporter